MSQCSVVTPCGIEWICDVVDLTVLLCSSLESPVLFSIELRVSLTCTIKKSSNQYRLPISAELAPISVVYVACSSCLRQSCRIKIECTYGIASGNRTCYLLFVKLFDSLCTTALDTNLGKSLDVVPLYSVATAVK